MPWFFQYGWIIPLIFLSVFLIFFLLNRRNFRGPMVPHSPCSYTSEKQLWEEKNYYNKKFNALRSDIEDLKRNVSSENKEYIRQQILQMEKELESLKKEI